MHVLLQSSSDVFNWHTILFGEDHWLFFTEVIFRSFIMFAVAVITVRLLGRKSINQKIFEIVVIISLGSAAGDAMFYSNVGIIPCILVFIMVLVLYKLMTFLSSKSKWIEFAVEGQHLRIIENGHFIIETLEKEGLSQDEYLADLRIESISHLGQIEKAYIESSGSLSIYYYPDDEVKYGLPVFPENLEKQTHQIKAEDIYACSFCGFTDTLIPGSQHICPLCEKNYWVKAINTKRVK
ncbi:MAG: DUF421 domain-containing protein [Fimbriimonadaceae bacterium]|nr:DUF421 domain-containing protein [Chitinophagales bacterium]